MPYHLLSHAVSSHSSAYLLLGLYKQSVYNSLTYYHFFVLNLFLPVIILSLLFAFPICIDSSVITCAHYVLPAVSERPHILFSLLHSPGAIDREL